MPSQTRATAPPRAANSRKTGDGPLRTARGAGRFFGAGLRLLVVFLPVERDREVEPPFAGVLLLRDAAGEDVRVAMVANVRENLTCPMRHTPGVVVGRGGCQPSGGRAASASELPRWSSSERQRTGVETSSRRRVVIG